MAGCRAAPSPIPPAAASAARAAGDSTPVNPFWSQPDVSTSAAVDAGEDATDHEAEVARAGGGDQPGLGGRHQPFDHGFRRRRPSGSGPPNRAAQHLPSTGPADRGARATVAR